ncbi:MAG: endolytic transglycosylase MltG [Pseudomonadota bacterium]
MTVNDTVLNDEAAHGSGKRRSKAARNGFVTLLNFGITCIILAIFGGLFVLYLGKSQFDAAGPLEKETTVAIPRGANLTQISRLLEAKGVIPRQDYFDFFRYGVRIYNQHGSLKAGEYAFKPGVSMYEVMNTLSEGKSILYSITFPEGWTSYQIIQRIAADETLTGDVPAIPEEGALLPNTYRVERGTTRAELVDQMKSAQSKLLQTVWESRAEGLPIKSPEEMVILASIVEKETGIGSERPHVASVFVNRLRKGMKLQSDPTIIYGLFQGKGKPKGRPIYRSDIDKPTDYNTYHIPALPPTPIANPGKAALEAVANPLITNDLFFVADGSGGHAFASTLDQHNQNVKRWREIERSRKEEAAKAPKPADGGTGEDEPATGDSGGAGLRGTTD